jgi:hypothetical protein
VRGPGATLGPVRAVLVVLVALVAAGCGAHSRSSGNAPPRDSLQALIDRPGENVAAVAGSTDFSVGDVRFSFLVITSTAHAIDRPQARVWIARSRSARPFREATAVLEPIGPPGAGEKALGGVGHIYVVHVRVPTPGRYWLVAEPIGGKPVQAAATLDVQAHSQSPAIGANAPPSRTPTLATTHGRTALLTTRVPPDLALLRYSVAGSLAAHKPFVVTFATPRYCSSRTCGPVVDVVDYVRRRFERRGIRFIHVEVYDRNIPARGYNRWMRQWNLHTEPWTFVVGADGRIKAKFMGSVSAGELTTAVRRFLLRR